MSEEETVLKVLREVIGNDAVTLTDDFYLVGGHSLLIVRIVRRLKKEFGLVLDPRQFGANSQVAALVAACHPARS